MGDRLQRFLIVVLIVIACEYISGLLSSFGFHYSQTYLMAFVALSLVIDNEFKQCRKKTNDTQ